MLAVVVDNLFSVIHATVADLDGVLMKIFLSFWSLGKCLSTSVRNLWPILVLTFLLNGGLYQRMLLRCLFLRLAVAVG